MDLTVIYITANQMPDKWMDFQIKQLHKAAKGFPIISISMQPMDLGENLLDDAQEKSHWNMYRQLCRGAKLAKTPYVAMAEDDTLYSREHFTEFRPKLDEVSYNRSRWSLFSWDAVYCLRQRVSNCSMIGARDLVVDALEERDKKHPDGFSYTGEIGREIVERKLGVSRRKMVEWYSTVPVIQLNHPDGIDESQQRKWKKHGQIKAYDIPYWGNAKDITWLYNEARKCA